MEVKVYDLESASHSTGISNYMYDYKVKDILNLFDGNPEKLKLDGYEFPFTDFPYEGCHYVIYIDTEYTVDRKEIEYILRCFFSDFYRKYFERKPSVWNCFMDKCIGYRNGKGDVYTIWQYTGKSYDG